MDANGEVLIDEMDTHVRRMNRVLDYIDAHLSDDLSLDVLAGIAHYSPFHFHRVFRARTGETLKDFVRRRRLDVAGGQLRYNPGESVTEVALACGFSSLETFARAFRQMFGMTATEWRNGGWRQREKARPQPRAESVRYPVEVVRLPEIEVLYWRVRGDYARVTDSVWSRFLPWVGAVGLGGQDLIGMGLDDPAITPVSRCRYDACVVLPADDGGCRNGVPPRASRKRIPGGWYACLEYSGDLAGIGNGWDYLLEDWLPQSGFILGDSPFLDRFPAGVLPIGDACHRCLLCMPVSPWGGGS